MKSNSTFNRLFALAFVLLGMNFTFAQNVITVDNNSTHAADYTSLQDAINAASNGDIIYVQHSNTSYGNVNVNKPLTVIGRSHDEINFISYVNHFSITSSDVEVRGLFIQNNLNIQDTNTGGSINNIRVKDCRVVGATLIGANYAVSNVVLQGNVLDATHQYTNATNVMVMNNLIYGEIRSYQPQTFLFTQNIGWDNQLYNYGDANGILQVSNSIFLTSAYWGDIETSGRYKIQNSITYNYYGGRPIGFNNFDNPANTLENVQLNTNPMFISEVGIYTYDISTLDLRLASGSPAIGAGFNGEDLGIYYNYAWSENGNPIGYPTITINSAPSSVPAGGDLNVTITAEAH